MQRSRGGKKGMGHVAPLNVQKLGASEKTKSSLPSALRQPQGILRQSARPGPRADSPKPLSNIQISPIPIDYGHIKRLGDSQDKPSLEDMGKMRTILLRLKALRIGRDDPKQEYLNNLVTGLSYLSFKKPSLFQTDSALLDLQSIFSCEAIPPSQRTTYSKFHQIELFTVNLIWSAYRNMPKWPIELARLFIEDSARNRDWVDHPLCYAFTKNIKAHFKTKDIPDEHKAWEHPSGTLTETPLDRFDESQSDHIQSLIIDHFQRRPAADSLTRPLVLLGASAAGFFEIRKILCSKLELMLNNPKLTKPGQEMFAAICTNATTNNEMEIINGILNVRHRQKPPFFFLQSLGLLIKAHPNNFSSLIQRVVFAEFEQGRNTQGHLAIMHHFLTSGQELRERTAFELARQFNVVTVQANYQQFSMIMRTLRNTIREISKLAKLQLGHFLKHFSRALLEECRMHVNPSPESRRMSIDSILDLANLCCYLRTATVRDQLLKGPISDEDRYERQQFANDIADIQQQQIRWAQNTFVQVFNPDEAEMTDAINQIMFLGHRASPVSLFEPNWPPDNDRNMMASAISSCDVREGTLLRLTFISRKFGNTFAMNHIWKIIERCCQKNSRLSSIDDPAQLTESLLQLAWSDDPPIQVTGKLASREALWKWCVVVLILSAFSPQEIGKHVWKTYPQMRLLITYCITGQILVSQEERQMILYQKQRGADAILVAEATNRGLEVIPRDDSRYLSDFCIINPSEDLRDVPGHIMDEITRLNKSIKLDALLSENRDPDFLELLVRESDDDNTLEWITELVDQRRTFDSLPISVLAEYSILRIMASNEGKKKSRSTLNRADEVMKYLEIKVKDNPQPLLDHIVKRLASESFLERSCASQLVFQLYRDDDADDSMVWSNTDDEMNFGLILDKLLCLRSSKFARSNLIKAIYVESDLNYVVGYLVLLEDFIALDNDNFEDVFNLATALSYFLVNRLLSSTSYLRDQDVDDNQNMLKFINKVFKKISEWIFITNTDANIEEKLKNWSCPKNSDCATFQLQGRLRCVPKSFIYSILIALSINFDSDLALTWLNDFNTDFIPEVKLILPKWMVEYLAGSYNTEMIRFALSRMSKADILVSSDWIGMTHNQKKNYLTVVGEQLMKDPDVEQVKQFPTIMISIASLKTYHEDGGTAGGDLLKALEKIVSRSGKSSPYMEVKAKSERKVTIERMESEVTLTSEILNYFNSPDVSSARLHSILKKMAKVEEIAPVIACLMGLMGQKSSPVFSTHCTGFGNMVRRLGLRLQKSKKLIDLEDFVPIMTRALTDERIKHNPKLSALRLICQDIHRKLFNKTKQTIKPKEISQNVEVKSLVALINEYRKKNSRIVLQNLKTSPDEDQLIGYLSDILVEDNHKVLSNGNESDLKLFFNASSQQLQSLFIHTASWSTILGSIEFLLTEKSAQINHSSVLDFLWAAERIRRLWKGREMTSDRCKEHIFVMTIPQLKAYLHHFVSSCKDESELEARLPQLLHFLRGADLKDVEFQEIRTYVSNMEAGIEPVRLRLENLLYLFRPAGQEESKIVGTDSSACATDKIVYRVILDLAAIGENPKLGDKMKDAFLFCISIGGSHPHLLLRHIPLMARLLKGRSHYELKDFRNQRHMDYFTNVAVILKLLDKYLLEEKYISTFKGILADLFDFLRVYPKMARRQCRPTVLAIFDVVRKYLELDLHGGLEFLNTFAPLWKDLIQTYSDIRDVQLYNQICNKKSTIAPENILMTLQNDHFRYVNQETKIHIHRLLNGNVEQVVEGLRTAQNVIADKGAQAVMSMDEDFLNTLKCYSPDARGISFDILLAIIRYDPGKVKTYYKFMIEAMEVMEGAELICPERVMQFTILAMTKAEEILKIVFNKGYEHDISVAKTIGRTISLLSLLPAY